jgi:GDSL-like lipase/acylhydrolase family protein
MREDCVAFARHWEAHNEGVLGLDGPLWVVLGDSTAQGLGAATPDGGYVGQVLAGLREQTGQPWRVLNLSVSGFLTRDVTGVQLPRIPAGADLVTCGIGVSDILYTSPGKLFADLRALIAALPASTVLLDLPLPAGCWGFLGRASVPYVNRINRTIRHRRRPRPARRRGLRALHAALGGQVRLRLLPPQPGRLPRLDPSPPGHCHPIPYHCHAAPFVIIPIPPTSPSPPPPALSRPAVGGPRGTGENLLPQVSAPSQSLLSQGSPGTHPSRSDPCNGDLLPSQCHIATVPTVAM